MDITARLEALAKSPKPWLVTKHYESGATYTLRQPREAMARAYAARLSHRMGRNLIDRETGETVRIVAVTVEYQPE